MLRKCGCLHLVPDVILHLVIYRLSIFKKMADRVMHYRLKLWAFVWLRVVKATIVAYAVSVYKILKPLYWLMRV